LIAEAQRAGRCDVVAEAVVRRLVSGRKDDVVGIEARSAGLTRSIRARHVVVAAGAVETARLLLLSGVGNRHDQVGRYLQGHPYVKATGVFDEPVQDLVGPGPSVAVTQYRHGNPGISGGGMLANEFVRPPVEAWLKLVAVGLAPGWGEASQRAMRELYPRTLDVAGPIQQAPRASSRVTLASLRDGNDLPVARLHPERLTRSDSQTARFLADRAVEWLSASGAREVARTQPDDGPAVSAGQHQAGTCRMGVEPRASVTDPWGRVWGHRGVSVADGSLHVTNGGVNPVLTIMALAWRVAEAISHELT
jgi:choline dehydrogenase-like flavoprotein